MARLSQSVSSSDESLPDVSVILKIPKTQRERCPDPQQKVEGTNPLPPRSIPNKSTKAGRKLSYSEKVSSSQMPLRAEHLDSLLEPISTLTLEPERGTKKLERQSKNVVPSTRQTPKRTTRHRVNYTGFDWSSPDDVAAFSKEDPDDGLSDFVVNDSASEEELRKPPRSVRKGTRKPLKRLYQKPRKGFHSADGEEDSGIGPALPGPENEYEESKQNSAPAVSDFESFDEPYANLKLYGLPEGVRK